MGEDAPHKIGKENKRDEGSCGSLFLDTGCGCIFWGFSFCFLGIRVFNLMGLFFWPIIDIDKKYVSKEMK